MKINFNLEAFKPEYAPSYREAFSWTNFKEKIILKTKTGEFIAASIVFLFSAIFFASFLVSLYEVIVNPIHLGIFFDDTIVLEWKPSMLMLGFLLASLYMSMGFLKIIKKELALDKFAIDNNLKFSNGAMNEDEVSKYKASFFERGRNFNLEVFSSNVEISDKISFDFGNFRKSEVSESWAFLLHASLFMSYPTKGFILLRARASILQGIYNNSPNPGYLKRYKLELVGDHLYLWRKKPFDLNSLRTYREVEGILGKILKS